VSLSLLSEYIIYLEYILFHRMSILYAWFLSSLRPGLLEGVSLAMTEEIREKPELGYSNRVSARYRYAGSVKPFTSMRSDHLYILAIWPAFLHQEGNREPIE
jgi:hypothetical protein